MRFLERQVGRSATCSALALALVTSVGAPPAGARPRRPVKDAAARNGNAAAEAKAAPAGRAAGKGPSVVFATDKRAYLNRGARDGLTAKQSVSLYRGGRAAGSCTIETLAQHQASCTGGRPRVGDSFRLPAASAAERAQAPVPKLPPRDDEATLRARAAAIADTRYDKVDFNGEHAIAGHAHAGLAPGIVVWRTTPDAGGDTTLFEVDGDVHVYDVAGTGASFDAAFSAMRWSGQAADGRFRPGAQSQFYLWEAELSKRRAEGRTVFAVGRIWSWHTPGLALIDGVQVGRRNQSETVEGGIYAGALPRELSVAPTFSSWASGAYAALVQPGSSKSVFRLAREEARIGISDAPETGFVADGEALAQAWLAGWNVAAGGRIVRSTARAPQPTLDRAYLDLGSRPTLAFGLGLHLRYFGGVLPAPAPLVAIIPAGRFVGGAADARWDPSAWLGFAAFAGAHHDSQSALTQGYAAAEVRLPRIIGVGGLAGGAEIDEGWLRSRLAYGQLAARFGDRMRVLARVSVAANAYTTPVSSPNIHELGGYLHLDGDLAAWLRLRAWSLLRVPLLIQGEFPAEATFGASGGLTLMGGF